jgi:hypothetical protein
MALIDFYQLAVLYKLRRADAGFLSTRSHPPPMSATPPPRSPSPSVEPDQAPSSRPPSTRPEPKTPEAKLSAARPVPHVTPISLGSSVRQRQDGDTDRVDKYDCADYDDYVREDLKSRVFVDFEVFMKTVLHAPDDWKTQWGRAIEAVKADPKFTEHHKGYCELCENGGTVEEPFYVPLVNTANAVLAVLDTLTLDHISCGTPQRYHVNHPRRPQGGVMDKSGLSPDLITLHKLCLPPEEGRPHWANLLHILEVKPFDNSICDATHMPRLIVDGRRAMNFLRVWP